MHIHALAPLFASLARSPRLAHRTAPALLPPLLLHRRRDRRIRCRRLVVPGRQRSRLCVPRHASTLAHAHLYGGGAGACVRSVEGEVVATWAAVWVCCGNGRPSSCHMGRLVARISPFRARDMSPTKRARSNAICTHGGPPSIFQRWDFVKITKRKTKRNRFRLRFVNKSEASPFCFVFCFV